MSHTPGPWHATNGRVVSLKAGRTVADMRFKNGDCDSLLVAAAPELLMALKGFVDAVRREPNISTLELINCLQPADAAIAQAEGR